MTELSEDVVVAYVSETVGRRVVQVRSLPGSVANQDFLARFADNTAVVVKAGPRAEMAAEAWACRRLTALGVPVPPVVALDLDAGLGGMATLVLGFLAGAPSESPVVAHEAGHWFRLVHAERLPGWGPLVTDDLSGDLVTQGRCASWSELILGELSGLPELVDAGVIDQGLARAARRCVLTDDLLGWQGPGVLLHNDLKPAHLFGVEDADAEHLAGIIDWGDARVGNPEAEIARLSMAGHAFVDAFLAGYGLQPTDRLADQLARYRIVWNVAALTYEHRAGGDWFDVYRERLRADIQRLR